MAHINGSFSSQNAGWLSVTLKGEYRRDAAGRPAYWWPTPNGTDDCHVRASVNGTKTGVLTKLVGEVSTQIFYPGDNVVWPVYTEEVYFQYGGQDYVGIEELELMLVLRKV